MDIRSGQRLAWENKVAKNASRVYRRLSNGTLVKDSACDQ